MIKNECRHIFGIYEGEDEITEFAYSETDGDEYFDTYCSFNFCPKCGTALDSHGKTET